MAGFPTPARSACNTASFADRAQDWLDIEGVIVRQGRSLDRTLVIGELRPLLSLKEDPQPEAHLARLFEKHPRQ